MINSLQDTVTLHNGVRMPRMGLGVFQVEEGDILIEAVKAAINNGYRSVDTASFYQNEKGVGQAIKESGIPREEIFVTTKVWNDEQGYESTLQAFESSLDKLELDYLDLYLIHWPVTGIYKETWKAMEKLYTDGKVRAIGVCNFHVHHLQELLSDCQVRPMINQVEFHPHLTQLELRDFCAKGNIQLEAWSPLKSGGLLNEAAIKEIAEKHQKSSAQVILRWDLQHNVITIPKSTKEHRIKENADIFDFSLTEEEMEKIDKLNLNDRCGPNPDTFV
ncbi:aldo/keto reductase [Virgibacillus indicus]|uniref:Aldo/keto reductase n=1 Tax=Virgibacillus indicus TaxID=2024554 RepID=A0A265N806_9BACI|nr:aldo/keto reductase [Virgibacillus indicus]OZU88123.1 aldo/keto reductase [Virgibacillus indicus]